MMQAIKRPGDQEALHEAIYTAKNYIVDIWVSEPYELEMKLLWFEIRSNSH